MSHARTAERTKDPLALERECFLRGGQIASLTGDLHSIAAFLRDHGFGDAAALTECLASQHGLPALKRRGDECGAF